MVRFRRMYPLRVISRGYVAPIYPIPAVVTVILASAALFGMILTYRINMISGIIFYSIASLWFVKRRYKFINQEEFLKAGFQKWGVPHI